MKNLVKSICALSLCALLFSSCASLLHQPVNDIKLGMNKQEVITHMGKYYETIGARKYANGSIEVLSYVTSQDVERNRTYRKWLYFYNDKLMEISEPGNWQLEADNIVADNDRAPAADKTAGE